MSNSNINNLSREKQVEIIGKDPFKISEIEKPDLELQIMAIDYNIKTISHIQNLSYRAKIHACTTNEQALAYIENPDDGLKFKAVKNFPYSIQYIKDPSEELQLLATKDNIEVLKYIKNPTESVQLNAIEKSVFACTCIKNLSEKVELKAFLKYGTRGLWAITKPSENLQRTIVQQNPSSLRYIENPNKKIQALAIECIYDMNDFINQCLHKITDSSLLDLMIKKSSSQEQVNVIKQSKYYKDFAQSILDIIDED